MAEVIGQRELRNDNAEVMRRVEAGETFVVTRRGTPVADLVPHRGEQDLRPHFVSTREIVARATGRQSWSAREFAQERAVLDAALDDEQRDPWG